MGRTIPSFRIATVIEEEEWKLFRKYLKNKNDKKLFREMFSIGNLYNSACSNAANPIRIYPIIMSIILHHYKKILSKSSATIGLIIIHRLLQQIMILTIIIIIIILQQY